MDGLTAAAASGMRARMESLDMLANNLANVSAPGFKADREFYNTYVAAEAADSPAGGSVMPVIERQWTDFSQGTLTPTGNPLDVALRGKGFFVATSSSGPLFTRDGSFRCPRKASWRPRKVSKSGDRMENRFSSIPPNRSRSLPMEKSGRLDKWPRDS